MRITPDQPVLMGGYESRGIDRGDAVGQFTPEAERVIVDAVRTMARQTGRID